MSTRDDPFRGDLAAAQARADAAERDNDALREKLAAAANEQVRPQVPLPERFAVSDDGGKLVISWRWFKLGGVFLLLFGVALTAMSQIMFKTKNAVDILFALSFSAVGVAMAYTGLAKLLNRTRIEVTASELKIRHRPVPWRGVTIPRAQLEQIYVSVIETPTNAGPVRSYGLAALAGQGRKVTLIGRLDDLEQARWLEHTLERRLGIINHPVAGEAS